LATLGRALLSRRRECLVLWLTITGLLHATPGCDGRGAVLLRFGFGPENEAIVTTSGNAIRLGGADDGSAVRSFHTAVNRPAMVDGFLLGSVTLNMLCQAIRLGGLNDAQAGRQVEAGPPLIGLATVALRFFLRTVTLQALGHAICLGCLHCLVVDTGPVGFLLTMPDGFFSSVVTFAAASFALGFGYMEQLTLNAAPAQLLTMLSGFFW
jgi:hypothetical protein